MSNVCAGIGRGQMEVLPERVRQRRAVYDRYVKALDGLPGISFVPEPARIAASWIASHPCSTAPTSCGSRPTSRTSNRLPRWYTVRSEERRVGKEWVKTVRSRWSQKH